MPRFQDRSLRDPARYLAFFPLRPSKADRRLSCSLSSCREAPFLSEAPRRAGLTGAHNVDPGRFR